MNGYSVIDAPVKLVEEPNRTGIGGLTSNTSRSVNHHSGFDWSEGLTINLQYLGVSGVVQRAFQGRSCHVQLDRAFVATFCVWPI